MATLRALVRWAVLTSILAAVLFIAAGSTEIPSLRDYVAVLSALLLFTMVAVDPELARERAHPAGRDIDPGSRTASGFLFLVTVIFAALDVGRLHQSDSVPPSWQLAAIMVFAAALILQAAAMIVNPFFSPALRIQAERGHSVITRGPYRFLRHPGYLAMLIAIPASALGHRLVARLDSRRRLRSRHRAACAEGRRISEAKFVGLHRLYGTRTGWPFPAPECDGGGHGRLGEPYAGRGRLPLRGQHKFDCGSHTVSQSI